MKRNVIIKFAMLLILAIIAYIPTIQWMVDRWFASESYYGHGFLIPVVSLYFAWQRKKAIQEAKLSQEMIGLAIVAVGLLVHILSAALKIYFISGFSFVFVLYGLTLFSFGKDVTRNLVFPIFFLLAMIPLPLVLIGNLTVKLKLFVAEAAALVLNRIGFPCVRDGSIIRMPTSQVFVEAPCSGLRSLISLVTLGLIFSYALKVSYLKKSILFLSSIPIAIVTNLIRILMLAIINDLYGQKIAMGYFHDFSGFLMFGIAFALLYGVSRMLERSKVT